MTNLAMTVSGAVLAPESLAISKGFVGLTEVTGHNDGPQIDKMESIWSMRDQPYCGMGQIWCDLKALAGILHVSYDADTAASVFKSLLPTLRKIYIPSPSCAVMIQCAKGMGIWRRFVHQTDVFDILPGDLVFYDFGTPAAPKRHVERFDHAEKDGQHMWVMGFNTSPTTGSQNDGEGAWYKRRAVNPAIILGSIRVNRH